jgi:chromate transporter
MLLPEFQENRFVSAALRGIRPVVAALILRAAVKIGRLALRDTLTWGLAGAALFLMLFCGAKPFWLILGSAAVGVVLFFSWRKMALRIIEKENQS